MITQHDKVERFRALHTRRGAFILPNPRDLGSARRLAGLGFEALASTSSGFARAAGKRGYEPRPQSGARTRGCACGCGR